MEIFTLSKIEDFFKRKEKKDDSFLLKESFKLTVVNLKKYRFIISNNNEVIYLSKEYTNYNILLKELMYFLKKENLFPIKKKLNKWEVIISSTINEYSEDISLDPFFSEKNNQINERLSQEDIIEFTKNDKIEKIFINWNNLKVIMFNWIEYNREYSFNNVIKLIIWYLKELVNQKKDKNIIINNVISLFFLTKSQNLNIIEWIDDETSINWDEGFVDKNLINNFTLCSLSELSIKEIDLKIWLNKIIIQKEEIKKIYFW